MSWLRNIGNRLKNSRINDPRDEVEIDFEQEKAAAKLLIQSGVKFHLHHSADGRTKDGERFYSNVERSSDGIWIESTGAEFRTPQKARKAFEDMLKGSKVLLRVPELDSTGKQIGEKVVAVAPMKGGEYRATIAVFGPTYCADTSSRSLRHLLARKEIEWLH